MPESGQAVVGIPDLEKENAELKMKVDAMRTMSNQLWHQYYRFSVQPTGLHEHVSTYISDYHH